MKKTSKIPLIVICILDGWGITPPSEGNAISQADTSNFDKLIADYPVCTLKASGLPIGLSKNQTGNCEAGHYSLGTSRKWPMDTVNNVNSTLCGCLRQAGYKLSYLSDSEKIAYITHFFNGGANQLVEEAEIIISPSPRVDNYKNVPELVSAGLYKYAKKAIKQRGQNAVIINFSILDLVARTGSLTASIKSTLIIDSIIGDLAGLVSDKKGVLAIVADHGNAEVMLDPATGAVNDTTTDNPVPFIIAGYEFLGRNIGWQEAAGNDLSVLKPNGSLLDFTPTILDLIGLDIPEEMEGRSLLAENRKQKTENRN